MKLNADQLSRHLQQQLAPLYLISSDELLLINESVAAICAKATEIGFTEHLIFDQTDANLWENISMQLQSRSLFANKQILECRLTQPKFSAAALSVLQKYTETKPTDKLLIIITSKLTPQQQNSAWHRLLENAGVAMTLWPINAQQFPIWLKQRLQAAGFTVEPNTLPLLTEHLEGNLLAAKQFIEKLQLLYHGSTHLTADQLITCLTSNARYTVFNLVDAIWLKQLEKISRILKSLAAENLEPAIVLWAITRECRKRKQDQFLAAALKVDLIIKGITMGQAWDALEQLCFMIAGKPLFVTTEPLLGSLL